MTVNLTIKYRISGSSGILFVRERICGEIVARISSRWSPLTASQVREVIQDCQAAFVGPVVSLEHEEDVVYVTC